MEVKLSRENAGWTGMIGLVCGVALVVGCSEQSRPTASKPPANPYGSYGSGYGDVDVEAMIQFKDEVAPQANPDGDLTTLTFTDKDGKQIALKDYLGKQHVILVVTRGYGGAICPYCSTQTSRLISNYAKFQEQQAEVIVVYPLEKPTDVPRLDEFVARAVSKLPAAEKMVPFPLLLDVELKAVDTLGIRKDLSKPATYIFDKEGQLRFAYVGNSLADRPSVKALLDQLGQLNKS
jgi:peroxiredoxin